MSRSRAQTLPASGVARGGQVLKRDFSCPLEPGGWARPTSKYRCVSGRSDLASNFSFPTSPLHTHIHSLCRQRRHVQVPCLERVRTFTERARAHHDSLRCLARAGAHARTHSLRCVRARLELARARIHSEPPPLSTSPRPCRRGARAANPRRFLHSARGVGREADRSWWCGGGGRRGERGKMEGWRGIYGRPCGMRA